MINGKKFDGSTLALIHTGHLLIPVFHELCRELLPGTRVFHILDESLIRDTIAAGRLEKAAVRRLVNLVGSAGESGSWRPSAARSSPR
jgi:hypothetical protein